jgi:hypothetical protein
MEFSLLPAGNGPLQHLIQLVRERSLLDRDLSQGLQLAGYPSRRGKIRRHCPNGAVIADSERNGVQRCYHATKGWRIRRVAPAPIAVVAARDIIAVA